MYIILCDINMSLNVTIFKRWGQNKIKLKSSCPFINYEPVLFLKRQHFGFSNVNNKLTTSVSSIQIWKISYLNIYSADDNHA